MGAVPFEEEEIIDVPAPRHAGRETAGKEDDFLNNAAVNTTPGNDFTFI